MSIIRGRSARSTPQRSRGTADRTPKPSSRGWPLSPKARQRSDLPSLSSSARSARRSNSTASISATAAATKPRLASWKRSPPEAYGSAASPTRKTSIPSAGSRLREKLGALLFRWPSRCIEENVIALVPDDKLFDFIADPADVKTGMRLRTLADRLGVEDKDFASLKATAGANFKALIIQAALGTVPPERMTRGTSTGRTQALGSNRSRVGGNWPARPSACAYGPR